MIGAAAEVVVVNEDRRREEERRPGAPRYAGVGGAGQIDEPANGRGDARQGPEEEEELEMEEHHPAELRIVPLQIQPWNEESPGVNDAGEVRDVARVVRGKGDEPAGARVVDGDGDVLPRAVEVDGVGREGAEVNEDDARDSEDDGERANRAPQRVGERRRRLSFPLGGARESRPGRAALTDEMDERPGAGGEQDGRERDREGRLEEAGGAADVETDDDAEEPERGAAHDGLERGQAGDAQRAGEDEMSEAHAGEAEKEAPAPEHADLPEQPLRDRIRAPEKGSIAQRRAHAREEDEGQAHAAHDRAVPAPGEVEAHAGAI